MDLDKKNGNDFWKEAEATEMRQLLEYNIFIDKGTNCTPTSGYNKIHCHMVYNVKHDGRGKACLVAGGHLTDPNTDIVYSSVVYLHGIRLVVLLAEIYGLDLWGADVGNAYLEAKIKEKVYIVGGPEFGSLDGPTLLVDKELYSLRSSGLRWYERLADELRPIGFTQ
jgi:Reverse transcriptase (RNA-dependent DNA polymerase)